MAYTFTHYIDCSLASGLNDGSSVANAFQSWASFNAANVAAGSIVAVRTHDGAANITETLSANLTIATQATEAAPVIFFFDDGTVDPINWTSSGQFQFIYAGQYTLAWDNYVIVESGDASDRRLAYISQHTNVNNTAKGIDFGQGRYEGFVIDGTGCSGEFTTQTVVDTSVIIKDVLYRPNLTKPVYNAAITTLFNTGNYTGIQFINPVIDLDGLTYSGLSIFSPAVGFRGGVEILGGRVIGGNSNTSVFLPAAPSSSQNIRVKATGFDRGGAVKWIDESALTYQASSPFDQIEATGAKGGGSDYFAMKGNVLVYFKDGETYPYIDAKLPDSGSSGWSFQVKFPVNVASDIYWHKLPKLEKYYQAASASKTIRVELIFEQNESPTKDVFWADIYYVSATTGNYEKLTTKSTGALASSDATWSQTPPTWAGNIYSKFKLEAATPDPIQQDSIVFVQIYSRMNMFVNANPIFIHPDIAFD